MRIMSAFRVSKLQSAYDVLRSAGVSGLLKELSAKVVTVETYLAYHLDLRGVPPDPNGEIVVAVRRAQDADYREFRRLPAPFPRHAEFRDKFGLDQCYIGFLNHEIAHLAWIYYPHEAMRHPTPFRRLRPDEVAIANCVTLPAFKGRGVYPAVLRQLLAQLQSEGYRQCFMYIDAGNNPSQRGVIKVGFKPVGRSWRVRFFFHKDPAAGIYIRGACSRANT
jgi:RimJ/RimL family protein N-acetyltransferase